MVFPLDELATITDKQNPTLKKTWQLKGSITINAKDGEHKLAVSPNSNGPKFNTIPPTPAYIARRQLAAPCFSPNETKEPPRRRQAYAKGDAARDLTLGHPSVPPGRARGGGGRVPGSAVAGPCRVAAHLAGRHDPRRARSRGVAVPRGSRRPVWRRELGVPACRSGRTLLPPPERADRGGEELPRQDLVA
jgi:hypothetical protein